MIEQSSRRPPKKNRRLVSRLPSVRSAMPGGVPDDAVRRANLVEVLSDSHPSCPPPPEDAHLRWSEAQIRAFFRSGGAESPDGDDDGSESTVAKDVDEVAAGVVMEKGVPLTGT